MGTSKVLRKIMQQCRLYTLGALVASAMALPTTALGWDYAQVPLFWDTGVHPNVAFMIDDSRSMQYMSTNEAFSRWKVGTDPVALTGDTFYFCSGYNRTSNACSATVYTLGDFTVQTPLWPTPATVVTSVGGTLYGSACASGNNGVYRTGNTICRDGHGMTNDTLVTYTGTRTGGSIGGLTVGNSYFVVNASTRGFQLSNTIGGAVIAFPTFVTGTGGNFTFSAKRTSTVPDYVYEDAYFQETFSGTSINASLCDVSKTPGTAGYYLGQTDSSNVWLSTPTPPLPANLGVLVSNKSGGGGTKDSCVRWKEGNTAQSPTTAGTVCNSLASCAAYPASRDVYTPYEGGYGAYLAKRLVTAKSVYNFANAAQYPDTDSDPNTFNSGFGVGSDYRVIPNVKRIEAAREAAQQIVLDNYTRMQIGLFSFTAAGSGERNQSIGNGSNPTAEKTALISTTEGMSPTDLPASAGDGAIGLLKPETATPLANTQQVINNYFSGASSPIQYRCQKNYAVVMTDGDPTSDSDTLDNRAQQGYDTDAKTSGTDTGGGSYQTMENSGAWTKQRIETFTVGFGLENDLLKRTPLVNRVNVTKSEITSNRIKLISHGLSTGDYFEVVSGAAGGLTNGSFYYAAKIDGDLFKVATTKAKAATCAAGTTADCVTVGGGSGTMVVSTGPGKALFAFTPAALSDSLGDVFNRISALTASASAVSTNSKQLGADTLVYQARFNTEDWSGEVAAYGVDATTGAVNTAGTPAWTTKSTLDTLGERGSLFTWNTNSNAAVSFSTLAGIGTNLSGLLNNDIDALNWLRGATIATPGFRSHSVSGLMGDVINADPVYVGALNFGFNILPASNMLACSISGTTATGSGCTGAEIYKDFLAARKLSVEPMLFVGTNGGQVHALRSSNGTEIMAYYPAGVFEGWNDIDNDGVKDAGETEKKMYSLTQDSYDHRFFVDGSAATSDAFTGSTWKTYLVGGLGAGGRSVYAIDVSDSTFNSSDFKWEFTHANLGLTYGKPTIARFSNNKWYAVFPNGLDSTGDKASVFVVNLTNAADFHELTVTNGDSAASPNGMMTVGVALDSNRTASYIYGGDIKGNVWKFDVSASTFPAGTKLFTARDSGNLVQSITGGIRIGKFPGGPGNLVYFGTGKYFENTDKDFKVSSIPQIDSFYAVWDDGSSSNIVPGNLQEQTFTTTGNLRTATKNAVDYSGGDKGWYVDLTKNGTKQGERVIGTPLLSGSRIIFISIIPSGGDKCIANGISWLNELNALDGNQRDEKVLDTNGDGVIDGADAEVAGIQKDGIISDPSIIATGGDDEKKIMGSTSSSNSIITVTEDAANSESVGGAGRMSWQQLQ